MKSRPGTTSRRRATPQRTETGRAAPRARAGHDRRSGSSRSSPRDGRSSRSELRPRRGWRRASRDRTHRRARDWQRYVGLVRCFSRRGSQMDPDAGAGLVTAIAAGARAGELAARSTIERGGRLKRSGTHPLASVAHGQRCARPQSRSMLYVYVDCVRLHQARTEMRTLGIRWPCRDQAWPPPARATASRAPGHRRPADLPRLAGLRRRPGQASTTRRRQIRASPASAAESVVRRLSRRAPRGPRQRTRWRLPSPGLDRQAAADATHAESGLTQESDS